MSTDRNKLIASDPPNREAPEYIDFEKTCESQIDYCRNLYRTAVSIFDKYKSIRSDVSDMESDIDSHSLLLASLKDEIIEIKTPIETAITNLKNEVINLKNEMALDIKAVTVKIKNLNKLISDKTSAKDKQLKILKASKRSCESYLLKVSKHKNINKKYLLKTEEILSETIGFDITQ